MTPRPNGFRRVFAVPALLALVSAAGLIAALVGDGAYDVFSWLALGAPLAVILRAVTRPVPR